VNVLVGCGFLFLLAFLWIKDSFRVSSGAFLYLFPYLFLFFSQDMMGDEIRSGALENVIFVSGRFRVYLLSKNALVAACGLGIASVLFSAIALYGSLTRQFETHSFGLFATGILVDAYYVALAGFLSLFFRAGSNVLAVLLGQIAIFVALLFSASQRSGLAARLTDASVPGMGARLEFLGVSLVLPNIIIGRRSWLNLLGLGAMTGLLFALQSWKIGSLELRKK